MFCAELRCSVQVQRRRILLFTLTRSAAVSTPQTLEDDGQENRGQVMRCWWLVPGGRMIRWPKAIHWRLSTCVVWLLLMDTEILLSGVTANSWC